jgi:hypothetical protein
MKKYQIYTLILLIFSISYGEIEPKLIPVSYISKPIKIDAIDDEWNEVSLTEIENIKIRIAYDDKNLYFFATSKEEKMPRKSKINDELSVLSSDRIELVFAEERVGEEFYWIYYFISIDPQGNICDRIQKASKDNKKKTEFDITWNSNINVKTLYKNKEWIVEGIIPLEKINLKPIANLTRPFMINRIYPNEKKTRYWHRMRLLKKEEKILSKIVDITDLVPPVEGREKTVDEKIQDIQRTFNFLQEFFDAISSGVPKEEIRKRFKALRGFLYPWFGDECDFWQGNPNYDRVRDFLSDPELQMVVNTLGIFLTSNTKKEFLERMEAQYGPDAVNTFNRRTQWGKLDPQMPDDVWEGLRQYNIHSWHKWISNPNVKIEEIGDNVRYEKRAIIDALENYKKDIGRYPDDLRELYDNTLISPENLEKWKGPYINIDNKEILEELKSITYFHDREKDTYKFTSSSSSSSTAWLGITTRVLTKKEMEELGISYGVIIENVAKDSPAERANLKKGDIILKIENQVIDTSWKVKQIIEKYSVGSTITFEIMRDKNIRKINVTLEAKRQ